MRKITIPMLVITGLVLSGCASGQAANNPYNDQINEPPVVQDIRAACGKVILDAGEKPIDALNDYGLVGKLPPEYQPIEDAALAMQKDSVAAGNPSSPQHARYIALFKSEFAVFLSQCAELG